MGWIVFCDCTFPDILNRKLMHLLYLSYYELMNMRIKSVLKLFCLLVLTVACQKQVPSDDPAPESLADRYCGKWFLYKIETSQYLTDINSDGKKNANLLDEYYLMPGYWEPNHVAEVVPALPIGDEDQPAITFNVNLPYPDFIKSDDGTVEVTGVKYLPLSYRVDEEDIIGLDGHRTEIMYPGYPESAGAFLSGIDMMEMIIRPDDMFWIRMQCDMIVHDGDEISEVSMDFFFRRLEDTVQ